MAYTKTEDFALMIRSFRNEDEKNKAEALIEVIEDKLRMKAHQVEKDLDDMINEGIIYESVLKGVVCGILVRCLNEDSTAPYASQITASANGYAQTYSPISSGDIFIKDNEYSTLGILKRKSGVIFHEIGGISKCSKAKQ